MCIDHRSYLMQAGARPIIKKNSYKLNVLLINLIPKEGQRV